jgi:hypothetical protein
MLPRRGRYPGLRSYPRRCERTLSNCFKHIVRQYPFVFSARSFLPFGRVDGLSGCVVDQTMTKLINEESGVVREAVADCLGHYAFVQ